jgi:hypothetical protein
LTVRMGFQSIRMEGGSGQWHLEYLPLHDTSMLL